MLNQPISLDLMDTNAHRTTLPNRLIIGIAIICALPTLLNLLGFNFSSPPPFFDTSALAQGPDQFQRVLDRYLSGVRVHTLLEWTSVWVAFITVIISFVHYSIARDFTTPIIGLALVSAGTMDAFHILAANDFIQGISVSGDLISFTWSLSRVFNAAILIMGAGLFLGKQAGRHVWEEEGGLRLILIMAATFGTISASVIYFYTVSPELPQTVFPDAVVIRPWDTAPLILYLIAGFGVLPRYYKRHPNLFSHALIVSVIPQIVSQLHAAYWSTALYDNHFHIASFLKIIAYSVPLIGLLLDYRRTYQESERRAKELARSNAELEQFAYVASHDLQEPLRKIVSYIELLEQRYKGKLDESADKYIGYVVDGSQRMRQLIRDLLAYSRAGRDDTPLELVDFSKTVANVIGDLQESIKESGAVVVVDALPVVMSNPRQINQLFQNLIGNAIKYHGKESPKVEVKASRRGSEWVLSVKDNGIGIDPQYSEKVFGMFQRLHTQSEYPGTGIGLAICKRIVDRAGGKIWLESERGKGATFFFTISAQSKL